MMTLARSKYLANAIKSIIMATILHANNAIASGDVGVIYIVAIFLLSLLASVYCAIFVKSDAKFRIFKIFIIVIWLASLFYFGQMKGVSSFAEMYAIFSSLLVFFICLKK